MEKGLKTLQVAGRAASRRDRIIVQNDALQSSNFDDFVDRTQRSPLPERSKQDPMSDDGFNDSAIGSAIGPDVEHTPLIGNLDPVMRENHHPNSDRQTIPGFRETFGMSKSHSLGRMPSMLTSKKRLAGTVTPVKSSLQKLPLTVGRTPSPRSDCDPKSREQLYDQKRTLQNHAAPKIDKQDLGQHQAFPHSSIDVSESSDALRREDISSEEICSAEDASPPSESGMSRLELLHAKHQIVVNIMRDVYVLFDPQWTAGAKNCAGHEETSSAQGPSPNNSTSRSKNRSKRKSDELDPEPPGESDDGKRRNRGAKQPGQIQQAPLYACPFNKFAPQRYCITNGTGQKYRTCWRPGFDSMARVRSVHSIKIQQI